MNFWIAIRDWLADLIGDTTIRDVQVSVAAGLAMLAFDALDEVEGSYLHPVGRRGTSVVRPVHRRVRAVADGAGRLTVPGSPADRDRLGQQRDPACQWTAAAALSGELGAAYPATAAARLWHLVGQWRDVPTEAVIALASLFATLTRVREGQEAHQVLTLLQERMNRVRRQVEGAGGDGEGGQDSVRLVPSASWREDRRNRERAMLCILEVLAVRDPLTKHPSITSFLQGRPEHLGLVAELWTVVLVHRPYRKRALVALLDAVRGFDHVSDDPETAARSLGDALTEALPAAEHPPFSADFLNIVARSNGRKATPRPPSRRYLKAFKHLEPTGRAAE